MHFGIEAGQSFSNNASDTRLLRLVARDRLTLVPQENWGRWSLWWEGSAGAWRYRADGQTKHLLDIGVTPIVRYFFNGDTGPFLEGGVGAHYLSRRYERGDTYFSTHWQFGSHLGMGYRFAGGAGELTLRVQHLSNGGLEKPNPGVNFALLSVSTTF